jgi:hypothetical protein
MVDAPLSVGAYGDVVARLHGFLQGQGYPLPPSEVNRSFFGPVTRQAVLEFQRRSGLPITGAIDRETGIAMMSLAPRSPPKSTSVAPVLGATLDAQAASLTAPTGVRVVNATPVPAQYRIQGSLVFDHGLSASEITTRLYNIGFAGEDMLLGQTTTDSGGNYSIQYALPSGAANIQLRVLDSARNEVTLSTTKYNAATSETLNLVVPAKVRPLAPEFERFASDMTRHIDGVERLADAQENAGRQDLTLVNQSTGWDARVAALGALSAQHAKTTGLSHDVLYAMFRVGLPSDPATLARVPASAVRQALTKANSTNIASFNADQIEVAVSAFSRFAQQTQLASAAPGGISHFGDLLAAKLPNTAQQLNATQQQAFANLYFSNPKSADLWTGAASLGIAADTLDALKLQGKFLYLTFNNLALANALQAEIGQVSDLPQLAAKDFYSPNTWQTTLQNVARSNQGTSLDALIPSVYPGATADRLAAYAGDLARKVRFSFPTEVAARMIERNELALSPATAAPVTAFLRAGASLGYSLGRTPLNAFLARSTGTLPALDTAGLESLQTLHRLYQITPSNESLQTALQLGFISARQIASINKDDFIYKYGGLFPPGEAQWVYGRAQTVSSVTFNICSSAIQLDRAPPVYALSASNEQRQAAKNALVEQFPSIVTLFGNMDYCACDDCSSVLSPAAYFVDVLQFLSPPPNGNSAANGAGYYPLDVLIGKDATVPGRRPDLGALPLSCENTNTSMPYIDIVNEIFEYFIANGHLDTDLAYDTGTATTAELTAEPQNILPQVYNTTLKQALFPLNLPFDLWIETVRGFLNYFKTPLAEVLDTLRPVDALELFSDAHNYPYYRAQIFAESLGLSPSDYSVLTGSATTLSPITANWFKLYGYPSEAAALNGSTQLDPLSSAANLARLLGLTYQQLTDLLSTGFLNPGLYPLIYQFKRFGIALNDAFSYTGQPGYPALANVPAFEAQLAAITARYKALNHGSSFDAKTWLKNLLPPNYSTKVLVLADLDSGCNFAATTLKYADNATAATPLDFVKFNLFVRLWRKLGWSLDEVDRAMQAFLPANLPAWTDPGFGAAFITAWKTALVYLAHLDALNKQLAPAMGRAALLPFWANLPVDGPAPLYASLFLTPSVLNNDWAFDDPNGKFPVPTSDLAAASLQTLSAHLPSIQGVLGLAAADVTAILADAGAAVDTVSVTQGGQTLSVPAFTLTNLSFCYRYSTLASCLQLAVADLIALKQMSGLNPFQPPSSAPIAVLSDDVLFKTTLQFLEEVQAVQNSGFTVEDLRYLLRHQFDPVGRYALDRNAFLTLLQSTANGLMQIQMENSVPRNLMTMPETLLDQMLSTQFPTALLKNLFTLLTNGATFTATQSAPAPIDPTPFAAVTELSFSYDPTTQIQTLRCTGLLLDWKKAELLALHASPVFSALLNGIQQQENIVLGQNIDNILGVWASLVEYEAVEMGAGTGLPVTPLTAADPALTLSYDEIGQLQWAGYRGVLTDVKKSVLTAVTMPSAALTTLLTNILNDLQSQELPAYAHIVGSLLAMLTNAQTFKATATGVAPASQVNVNNFFSALTAAQQSGAITAPVPVVRFTYDAGSQTQTISCQGILTDALRGQLAALSGVSAACAGLLQSVRNSMVALFGTLATGLLTVAATDLDTYAAPFLGLDATKSQRHAKAQLIRVFQPLLAQKLSLQFVLQTLASDLAADPPLTQALVTDTALLADPSNPGKSLLGAFLGVGQQGVSAYYYAPGGTTPQASGTAATTDTADPTNNVPGTASCHFEGYLQVPTDGPYRFFAELGNTGATALLQLDAPSPAALFANPVIPATAATQNNAEISQFVTLRGGVFYHFTLDFGHLGSNGARLLIQGENLPKGPLSQVILCSQTAVDAFTRARTLLAKVLQILEVTKLDLREISYLVANATEFGDLRLSSLPSQASDASTANAVSLFAQMNTLFDYADLRKNPAGGSDGLIGVFEAVGTTFSETPGSEASNANPSTPWAALALLTRRNAADVRTIGEYFGLIQDVAGGGGENVTAVGDFGNNKGIRRIWQALQVIRIVGIPVSAVTACTAIAALAPPTSAPPPDQIATNFKNAVRARFTIDQWLPVAQWVFDPLRKMKRDALVAYLVNTLGLENANQLFEYFLVDPGMEPVVQTSRLRLALSSLQTFVQRCLLNLENGNAANPAVNVAPAAIDADWWSWMKRYRVWQANREIFLYPENWMVPELRTDMSDLFQTLESDLLQGDVTSDLVDDAFLKYLNGLELRARLDVVASYFDQNLTDAGISTLHVLGRTYSHPHQYFYRTYSSETWSAWQAVTTKIEGDHIALALWKGRLNLFWVTFINQAQAAPPPAPGGDPIMSLKFGDLANDINNSFAATSLVQAQLHWCEYYQGKWSTPVSSDVKKYSPIAVTGDFDSAQVYIRVSKDGDESVGEGALKVILDFPANTNLDPYYHRLYARYQLHADELARLGRSYNGPWPVPTYSFRITSKNCDLIVNGDYLDLPPPNPYDASGVDATLHTGYGSLTSTFQTSFFEGSSSGSTTTEQILQSVNSFGLLQCANPVVPAPFLEQSAPQYQQAGSLVAPFFYKDLSDISTTDEMTFYVQPWLTETTVIDWIGWAVPLPEVSPVLLNGGEIFNNVPVIAQVPTAGPLLLPVPEEVHSLYAMQSTTDWLTAPTTALSYNGTIIEKSGGINSATQSAVAPAGAPLVPVSAPVGALGRTIIGPRGFLAAANRSPMP